MERSGRPAKEAEEERPVGQTEKQDRGVLGAFAGRYTEGQVRGNQRLEHLANEFGSVETTSDLDESLLSVALG